MSVTLGIRWSDGRFECPTGIGQATARSWAAIARELKLEMLSQIEFNGWPKFDATNLPDLIEEFLELRVRLLELYPTPAVRKPQTWYTEDQINSIIDCLERLRHASGWDASFG